MSNNFEFYVKNGLNYDRITRILDYFSVPELTAWKLRVGLKEASRASKVATNIGTNVDDAIRADVQGLKKVKLKTKEAESCWEAWTQWKKDFSLNVVNGETVFNDELRVAATLDLKTDDCAIDIKCSSSIKPQYWLQTEFQARTSGFGYKGVLRLDKNLGCYQFKQMPVNDDHWQTTIGAIKLYRYYKSEETR